MIKLKDITCPTCGKSETWKSENAARPFCSERCKLIDLGDWAAEKHRIPDESNTPINDEDESKDS